MKNSIALILLLLLIVGCKQNPKLTSSKTNPEDFLCMRLLDSDSNQPLANFEIEIPKLEEPTIEALKKKRRIAMCGTGRGRKNYEAIKTDKNGEFYLSKKLVLNRTGIAIYIPSNMTYSRTMNIMKNEMSTFIYRCGYGQSQRIGTDKYHLDSNYVERIRYLQNETTIEQYDKFDIYTCTTQSNNKARDFAKALDEEYYQNNQTKLWTETWDEFERNVGDDLKVNPNADIWFQYVVALIKRFRPKGLRLQPLIQMYDETESLEKKYNLLYAIFKVRRHHIQRNLDVNIDEENKIKRMYNGLYEQHADFIQEVTGFKPYRDDLKRMIVQQESMYKYEGNLKALPNMTRRVRMID